MCVLWVSSVSTRSSRISPEINYTFDGISPEFTGCHQNFPNHFTSILNWSTLRKGITTTQPSHWGHEHVKVTYGVIQIMVSCCIGCLVSCVKVCCMTYGVISCHVYKLWFHVLRWFVWPMGWYKSWFLAVSQGCLGAPWLGAPSF